MSETARFFPGLKSHQRVFIVFNKTRSPKCGRPPKFNIVQHPPFTSAGDSSESVRDSFELKPPYGLLQLIVEMSLEK